MGAGCDACAGEARGVRVLPTTSWKSDMAAEREGFAVDNSSCEHVHALCGGWSLCKYMCGNRTFAPLRRGKTGAENIPTGSPRCLFTGKKTPGGAGIPHAPPDRADLE